jgi:hypothetical protein
MEPVAQLAAVLVAPDPQGAAEHALAYLMGVHGASMGAVLALRGKSLVPYATREMEGRRLDTMKRSWPTLEGVLRAGRVVRMDDLVLYPLEDEGIVVGLVLVGGRIASVREELFKTFGVAMAKAIQVAPPVGPPAARPTGLAKEALLVNLAAHEWNIARVARMMGVTRRTIYLRLRRYGIDRVRIPKVRVREAVT